MLSTEKGAMSLYLQVKELLIGRIRDGVWMPGDIIPSEIALAQELGVSQGTVRKAVTELVENNLLTRKQGRGTFVSTHDPHRALFHFFHLTDDDGHKMLPESRVLHCRQRRATRKEAARLQLGADTEIIRIERVRYFLDSPVMVETITLAAEPFGKLARGDAIELPNTLYELYENEFGITIHSADERLRAVAATRQDASILGIEAGSPLLEIERIAMTMDRSPVELRISRCNTSKHHYRNTIF